MSFVYQSMAIQAEYECSDYQNRVDYQILCINLITNPVQSIIYMQPFDLALCLLFISLGNTACSNKFHPRGSECTFYYNFSDSEKCEDFHFINCTWTECVQNTTTYNQTTCVRYEDKNSILWEYCSMKCCLGFFQQAYSSLQQCEDHLTKISNFVTIVIISVLVLAVIGAGLNKLFQRFKRRCKDCEGKCKSCPSKCFHLLTFNIFNKKRQRVINRSLDDNFLAEPMGGADWKQGQLAKDHKCGVCEKMDCTVRLKCKHWYHRFCARQLVGLEWKCRVCSVQCTQSIKIYCRSCKNSYFKISKEDYESSNDQVCPNCELTVNPS